MTVARSRAVLLAVAGLASACSSSPDPVDDLQADLAGIERTEAMLAAADRNDPKVRRLRADVAADRRELERLMAEARTSPDHR